MQGRPAVMNLPQVKLPGGSVLAGRRQQDRLVIHLPAQVPDGAHLDGANASAIRKFLFDENQLKFLAGCENKGAAFFPGVHPQTWFALYAAQRGGRTEKFRVTFGVDSLEKAAHALVDAMELEADVTRQFAPDTYAIPDLRNISELTTSRKMGAACPAFGNTTLGPPVRHYSAELHK